jgi:response regulator RpfG family c-di-GMP phosphodiesterase
MSGRVLIVDDDTNLLAGLRRQFRNRFDLHVATGGDEALALATKEGPFAVAMVDMRMPGMDGVTLLSELHKRAPDTVRIMLTGNADQQTAVDAINKGRIFRFFSKPCDAEELAKGIEDGLRQYELVMAERVLLEKTLAGSVKVLVDVLSMIDPVGFGRATRVRDWCRLLTKEINDVAPWEIEIAALLSPLGFVTVPAAIVEKGKRGERLTAQEKDIVARVPSISRDLIVNIPRLERIAEIVYCTDRAFDGSIGWPDTKPVGEAIPVAARILHLLFDLATETERKASLAAAFKVLSERHGAYDPRFMNVVRDTLLPTETDPRGEIVELPVKLLMPGHYLKSDLMTRDGWLVLSAGNVLNQLQVERLRNLEQMYQFQEPVRIIRLTKNRTRR